MADWLETLRKKQQRAAELRAELNALEAELRDAKAILAGRFESPIHANPRPKSRHGFTGGKRARPIRTGSSVWWSQKILKEAGRPLPIDELLGRVNSADPGHLVLKPTLVSNLSRYVAHGDTFTRPAPSTFGLVEWEQQGLRGLALSGLPGEKPVDLDVEPEPELEIPHDDLWKDEDTH